MIIEEDAFVESKVEDFLEHFGVKGMKWGIRRSPEELHGIPHATQRQAKKDAKEYARAKMYYGEGAGTRRKLIGKSVEDRKSRDKHYAKAFDYHLNQQNLADHASKATKERKRTDRKDTVKKSGGYVARRLTGEMGTKAAVTAAAIGGAAYLRSPRGQAHLKTSKMAIKNGIYNARRARGAAHIASYLKNHS